MASPHGSDIYGDSIDLVKQSSCSDELVGTKCNCKSTCQRRKCPCKAAGIHCGANCKCGSIRKPCKNKPATVEEPAHSEATVSTAEARIHKIQELIAPLTIEQCHKLIVEAYSHNGGVEMAKAILQVEDSPPNMPEQPGNDLPWCVCRRCQTMDLAIENKCCRQRTCITLTASFDTICLDRDTLAVAIVNRSDFFSEDPEYTTASYRKAAYRQYIMWQHGYLGRGNRKVIPSCVIWAVRRKYPAPDGVYLGYKEY